MEATTTTRKSKEYYRSLKQNTPEWMAAREHDFDLTGSSYAAAIGLSKFCSRHTLRQKRRRTEENEEDERSLKAKNYGHENEDNAADEFHFKTGFLVQETGIWPIEAHRALDNLPLHLASSPDRLVYLPNNTQQLYAVYEAKCPYSQHLPSYPYLEHVIQVHGEIQAADVQLGFLHYWTPAGSRFFRIERDDALWGWILIGISCFFSLPDLGDLVEDEEEIELVEAKEAICRTFMDSVKLLSDADLKHTRARIALCSAC